MLLVSSCSCLCSIQMLSSELRCSWSSADRRCSNYIWVINCFVGYYGAAYIRGLTVIFLIHSQRLLLREIDFTNFCLTCNFAPQNTYTLSTGNCLFKYTFNVFSILRGCFHWVDRCRFARSFQVSWLRNWVVILVVLNCGITRSIPWLLMTRLPP